MPPAVPPRPFALATMTDAPVVTSGGSVVVVVAGGSVVATASGSVPSPPSGGRLDRPTRTGQVERLLTSVADRTQDEEPGDERDRREDHGERAADGRSAVADSGASAWDRAGAVGYVAHACAPPCASVPVSNRSRRRRMR
jgi:hypothetical protein